MIKSTMDFKNKVGFFLFSFFLSFSTIFFFKKNFALFNSYDLIDFVIIILCVFLIPFILHNIKISYSAYLISFILIIYSILKTDLYPLKYFLTSNILSIIFIIFYSLVITFLLKTKFIKRIFNLNIPLIKYLGYLSVFLLIVFLVYNPKYKYSFEKIGFFGLESYHQFYHVNFFIIPIKEILLGKTLLINVSSLYGIFLTYFNSLIFSIFNLTYSNFVLFDMLVTIIYTLLFFIIIKRVTNNFWLTLIGVLAFIRLNIFRNLLPYQEIFILPSTTPIRHFFDLIIFYQIYDYFYKPPNKRKLILMTFVGVFAFFYNFDFGLLMLLSYIVVLIYDIFLSIYHRDNFHKIKTKFFQYFSYIFLFILFFLINIFSLTFIRTGDLPNIYNYLFHISTQTVQLGSRSIFSLIGWHYFPLIIYLIGFYYVFYQVFRKNIRGNQEMVFLISYGLFTYPYFINLSEPNHLFSIIHPSIIIVLLLFKAAKNNFSFLHVIFFFSIFWVIFIGPPSLIKIISEKIDYRYSPIQTNYYFWDYPGTKFYLQDDDGKNFELASNKIKELTKNDKEIVIISRYSALLYMMTDKTSLLNHPNIENDIYSTQELLEAVKKIESFKPKYIFVYSQQYNQAYFDKMTILWKKIINKYAFKETAGVIDVYELK